MLLISPRATCHPSTGALCVVDPTATKCVPVHFVKCSTQLLRVYWYTMCSVPFTKVSSVRRVPLPDGKELPLFRR